MLSRRILVCVASLALVVSGVVTVLLLHPDRPVPTAAGGDCAAGYEPVLRAIGEVRNEMRNERASGEEAEEAEGEEAEEAEQDEGEEAESGGGEVDAELVREAQAELPMLRGTDPDDWDHLCVIGKRPESLKELAALHGARAIPRLAPYGVYAPGAAIAAAREQQSMTSMRVPGTSGTARRYGRGPLVVDDPRYPEVNGLGLDDNSGRIDSFAYDKAHDRLFAAVASGGIWRSDDHAGSWRSASGNLPTQVTGAVGWTRAHHGTLLALTGEPTFGANAFTGMGAYWSPDLGRTWRRAEGVPNGGLGFEIAVDPARPRRVYAATQLGLFVSRDGGRSYRNARLPTGKACLGRTDIIAHPHCALRNVVTDVVVSKGRGVDTQTRAGTVVAVVGWRGGRKENPDGSIQSTHNGVYRSPSGRPSSFKRLPVTGFAAQDAIGRVELGSAVGRGQDHDFLYAIVQDANLLNNGGVSGIDVPEGTHPPVGTTVLNGLYVSDDFGRSWTRLASGTELAADPTSGSALVGTGTAIGYQPGVQGWYNLYVEPDPTRATAAGVPTRMVFGLEEIWSNEPAEAGLPLDGTVTPHFRVVGKYFGGSSCLLLNTGLPACPGDREPGDDNDTTHPDQHDAIWVPDSSVPGGVRLFVGNDGGAYRYRFEEDSDTELDNSNWGPGDQAGFSTLLPYWASVADDGTVWAGLQDNGNLRVDPETHRQFETYGGDGFFTAVDPDDSDVSYEEYTNGAISVTTDGGTGWKSIDPGLTASKFANPFAMDPRDADHLVTAGREVVETLIGPRTDSGQTTAAESDDTTTTWRKVFDLGTRRHPGDESAAATETDPANSMSAVTVRGNAAYVGFCGQCDTLNKLGPYPQLFRRGLATNVGGDESPRKGTDRGWHIVRTRGLPNRYITSIAIDPQRRRRIFVTLGGYTRHWLPAGAVGDTNPHVGEGHLFVSSNGGRRFRDITGNLPDAPATSVAVRGRQLLVGTDVGAFAAGPRSADARSPRFAPLQGMPPVPVGNIALKPNDPNRAIVALYGRGIWSYDFDRRIPVPPDNEAPEPEIGQAFASYDFEDGDQGWAAGGVPTTWQHGTPGHGDGTAQDDAGSSWNIVGPAQYVDLMDATLVSPQTTAPGGPVVAQWWMKLDSESGFDEVDVEWSADGSSWKPLGSFSGRNPDHPGWSRYAVQFTPPAGPLQLRYRFTSDELCSGAGGPLCSSPDGWQGLLVDDVALGTPAAP